NPRRAPGDDRRSTLNQKLPRPPHQRRRQAPGLEVAWCRCEPTAEPEPAPSRPYLSYLRRLDPTDIRPFRHQKKTAHSTRLDQPGRRQEGYAGLALLGWGPLPGFEPPHWPAAALIRAVPEQVQPRKGCWRHSRPPPAPPRWYQGHRYWWYRCAAG